MNSCAAAIRDHVSAVLVASIGESVGGNTSLSGGGGGRNRVGLRGSLEWFRRFVASERDLGAATGRSVDTCGTTSSDHIASVLACTTSVTVGASSGAALTERDVGRGRCRWLLAGSSSAYRSRSRGRAKTDGRVASWSLVNSSGTTTSNDVSAVLVGASRESVGTDRS